MLLVLTLRKEENLRKRLSAYRHLSDRKPFLSSRHLSDQNNGDRGADKVDVLKYSQDPLQGIDSPMTRAKTKRMKEVLQGLIMKVQYKEAVLEDIKTRFEDFKVSPRMTYYLFMQGDGPMTRAKTKRMKEALQDLIMEVQYKEAVLEDSKTKFEDFKASPRMVYYLFMQGIDSKDHVGCKD